MAQSWKHKTIRYPADLPASIDAYAAYVEQAAESEQSIVLIAESFSGPIAIRAASRLGHKAKALALCASFATQPHILVRWASRLPASLLASFARQRWAMRWFCVGRRATEPVLRAVETELTRLSGNTIKRRLGMLVTPDVSRDLASLDLPVLLLQPNRDRLLDPWAPKRLEQLAPAARIERLDGPHFLFQAEPQACWNRIANWLTLALTHARR